MSDDKFQDFLEAELAKIEDEKAKRVKEAELRSAYDGLTPHEKEQLASFEGPSIMGKLKEMLKKPLELSEEEQTKRDARLKTEREKGYSKYSKK